MKILIFGGYVDYEIQLANALVKSEEVTLLLPVAKLEEEFSLTLDERVKLYLLGEGKPKYFKAPSFFWHILKTMWVLPHSHPDLVHVQIAGHFLITVICLYFSIFQKRPIVSTFHDVKPHIGEESKIQNILRFFIRTVSKAIIVHGVRLRQQMIQEYRVPADKVLAVSMGEHEVAPFKKYENPDIKESGKWILFFGRIYDYKGLDYLIQAEPIITREVPEAVIVIAGAGSSFKKYETLIGERKSHYIIHNYRIPYPQGTELFQKSSVVVLPYIEASQSGVVMTAYGFKKAIVATNTGSIPEIVEDKKTGILVPPGNSEKLAEAVISLLKHPDTRKQMGENGYFKLKTDLSFDLISKIMIEKYKNILRLR
jgi:alpha-maltose-1-phosphate synthase